MSRLMLQAFLVFVMSVAVSFAVAGDDGLPKCEVDQSTQTLLKWGFPIAEYQKVVLPGLRKAILTHVEAKSKYTISYEHFKEFTGISTVFPKTNLSTCCASCSGQKQCANAFEFTKDATDPYLATFTFSFKDRGDELSNMVADTDTKTDLTLTFQKNLAGDAYFGPDFVWMRFKSSQFTLGIRQKEISSGKTTSLFEGQIPCLAVQPQWAVMQNVRYDPKKPSIPYLHFFLDPTSK